MGRGGGTNVFSKNKKKLNILAGKETKHYSDKHLYNKGMGCCGRDRMVVGFIPNCAISAYHH